jgi:hypothetical protein
MGATEQQREFFPVNDIRDHPKIIALNGAFSRPRHFQILLG